MGLNLKSKFSFGQHEGIQHERLPKHLQQALILANISPIILSSSFYREHIISAFEKYVQSYLFLQEYLQTSQQKLQMEVKLFCEKNCALTFQFI